MICSRCAAPLPSRGATCTYCGAAPSDPAASGEVVTASSAAHLHPGWATLNSVDVTPSAVPGEVVATAHKPDRVWYTALRTHGIYDDVDLSATFRFLDARSGDPMRAGFSIRLRNDLCYVPSLLSDGGFSLGAIVKEGEKPSWSQLVPQGSSDIVDARIGAPNRLRIVAIGDRLQVWINGVLLASVRDDRLRQGYCEVMVNQGGAPGRVAWSHLVLAVPR